MRSGDECASIGACEVAKVEESYARHSFLNLVSARALKSVVIDQF